MKFPRKRTRFAGCLVIVLFFVGIVAFLFAMAMGDDEGVPRTAIEGPDGSVISYLHAGDATAPRILYIHGSPGNARAWLDYLTDPIPRCESIAPDRPGFGHSRPADPEPSLKAQAAAIEPFLVQRNGKWPILVGHSLGGTIACRVAADYPERVGGLVVIAGALDPSLEKTHWIQRLGNFWVVPRILPRGLRNSNRELVPLKSELEELEPLIGEIRCPVIILHGKKDILVPVANVDFLEEHLPEESIRDVVLFGNRNHLIPWSEEAAIREAIAAVAGRGGSSDGSDQSVGSTR